MNIPFCNGFIKQAMTYGLSTSQASALLKVADIPAPVSAIGNAIKPALGGAVNSVVSGAKSVMPTITDFMKQQFKKNHGSSFDPLSSMDRGKMQQFAQSTPAAQPAQTSIFDKFHQADKQELMYENQALPAQASPIYSGQEPSTSDLIWKGIIPNTPDAVRPKQFSGSMLGLKRLADHSQLFQNFNKPDREFLAGVKPGTPIRTQPRPPIAGVL